MPFEVFDVSTPKVDWGDYIAFSQIDQSDFLYIFFSVREVLQHQYYSEKINTITFEKAALKILNYVWIVSMSLVNIWNFCWTVDQLKEEVVQDRGCLFRECQIRGRICPKLSN